MKILENFLGCRLSVVIPTCQQLANLRVSDGDRPIGVCADCWLHFSLDDNWSGGFTVTLRPEFPLRESEFIA